jgi:peroxiredoxin (alkyl hydroperoxide reductase subunit C)
VSTDTHFSHKAWHDTSDKIGKLTYPFLGDQMHTLATNFGVLREGQGLADRGTFVVDPDGVIQIMEITCEGVGRNANELTRKIRAAQYVRAHPGQVCPAAWEEGEETLAPSLDLVGKL